MVASLWAGRTPRHWPSIQQAGIVSGVLFVALQGWNWLYGHEALLAWHASRWQSLMALSFRDYGEIQHPYRLDFDPGFPREQTDKLKKLGYLHRIPNPYQPGDFSRFNISKKVLLDHKAGIELAVYQEARTEVRLDGNDEEYERITPEGWRIEGFADVRSKMGRVPDGIVFTIGAENSRTIIGFAEVLPQLPFYINDWDFEFARLNNQSIKTQTAWSANLRLADLPEGTEFPVTAEAWAIDFKMNRLYQIEGPAVLEAPSPAVPES
jgi:hypothetical protein